MHSINMIKQAYYSALYFLIFCVKLLKRLHQNLIIPLFKQICEANLCFSFICDDPFNYNGKKLMLLPGKQLHNYPLFPLTTDRYL